MEPITRKEKFLAKAGGQNIELPNPVTREEMFLAAIGGTSGGRGWVERKEVTVESKVDEPTWLEGFPAFAVGDTVTLKVDGVEYSLVAFDDGVPVVGDSNDGVNMKYGWCVACFPDEGAVDFYGIDSHTVSYFVDVVHKIDKKFLPDDIGGGADTMIMYAPSITVSSGNATFSQLYYDDGTPANYNTAERLANFLNAGGRCLLFIGDERRGEIMACFATETSSGFVLQVCGVTAGNGYGEGFGTFKQWLS